MIGFSLGGIHSSVYDIVMKTDDRSLIPELKKREMEIPGKHGSYDFGNNTYHNRIIKFNLTYIGSSYNNLRNQMREVSSWLSNSTYRALIFDDEPDIYYLAKIYSYGTLNNFFKFGTCNIEIECQPMALFVITSGQDTVWGDELIWGDDVAWDNKANHTISINTNTTFDIDYFGTVNLGSGSEQGSKFNIVITGDFLTLTLEINGKSITYGSAISGSEITIDNINMTVKEGSINRLSECSGDLTEFLHLENGINTCTISGTGLNCDILFDFSPLYL